ncbi:MAG: hypothetical protein CSA64_01930 [Arachnia propionica]|nr:MAG: hypothetical protein CSA64_01930 [Arachnia propionica]
MWWLGLVAVLAAAHTRFVVPRLPAPGQTPPDQLPDYQRLSRWPEAALVATVALVAWLIVQPAGLGSQLMWLAYLGGGTSLIHVDWRTTFLPRWLHYLVAAQLLAAVLLASWESPQLGLAAAAGSAVAIACLWLVWRLSGSLGFGDVRLASLTGALGGTMGLTGWLWSLFLGTLIGALLAIWHSLRRRRHELPSYFAYGPALWLGPIVASWLLRQHLIS